MLIDMSWLNVLKPFPPEEEVERLNLYERNNNFYEGRHEAVWGDLWDLADIQDSIDLVSSFFSRKYNGKKLPMNWFKVVSSVYSDMVVGEPPRFSDSNGQEELKGIVTRSDLPIVLYEACNNFIKFGNAVLKVRFQGAGSAEPGSIIENIDPSIWFPVVNPDNVNEYTCHVLAWKFKEAVGTSVANLLRTEVHTAGSIDNHLYWLINDKIDHEVDLNVSSKYQNVPKHIETGVPYPLVFVVSNIKKRNDVYGISDYESIENLVKELEIRIIKISSILDIHSRPAMTGPDSMLTTDMETGEETMRLNGRFFPVRIDEGAPAYLTWDGKLDSSFQEMDRLVSMIYAVTDLNPAAIGDFSGGAVASGSALRRLLLRTISHCNRIRSRFDSQLKKAIKAASILDVQGRIKNSIEVDLEVIGWQDGLPSDDLENSMIEQTRANAGLTSRSSSIMRLDGCTREEAEEELARIKEETPQNSGNSRELGAKPVPKTINDIVGSAENNSGGKAPLTDDIVSTLKDIGYFKTSSG